MNSHREIPLKTRTTGRITTMRIDAPNELEFIERHALRGIDHDLQVCCGNDRSVLTDRLNARSMAGNTVFLLERRFEEEAALRKRPEGYLTGAVLFFTKRFSKLGWSEVRQPALRAHADGEKTTANGQRIVKPIDQEGGDLEGGT